MVKKIAINWFRQDLRLLDNPSLQEASKHQYILPIYILDNLNSGNYKLGSASALWLHYSLKSLKKSLNGNLSVYCGDPYSILNHLLDRFDVEAIYWNRCYEPWRIKRDTKIKECLRHQRIKVNTYNASLLWEPWHIKKENGSPYKVFTPFYRKGCLQADIPRIPLLKPDNNNYIFDESQIGIENLNLLPKKIWATKIKNYWDIGEEESHKLFQKFINQGISFYKEGRNFPEKDHVSKMSPYLHFGQISPNSLWHALFKKIENDNIDHFCSELGWREFSYSQLYYNHDLPTKNLRSNFDDFAWENNLEYFNLWKKGQTGVPMVDAAMRELWETGYVHNRARMIAASFLVKNLLINWQYGERWFWDTLVDADLANNSASWQWVAGTGADAAPYFRIFNPVTQGQKFDPNGNYIRRYIPEIAKLPNKYLFSPWEAPKNILDNAGIKLGSTYPKPIVDLKASREKALMLFKLLKK